MTRINVGIAPHELPTKLLLAEHREIKRIPNCIKSGRSKIQDIPKTFTLGKGHVKFFYNKIKYLKNRYELIYNELILRGCNITDYHSCFEGIPNYLYNDYIESAQDRMLLIERIESKGFRLLKP